MSINRTFLTFFTLCNNHTYSRVMLGVHGGLLGLHLDIQFVNDRVAGTAVQLELGRNRCLFIIVIGGQGPRCLGGANRRMDEPTFSAAGRSRFSDRSCQSCPWWPSFKGTC